MVIWQFSRLNLLFFGILLFGIFLMVIGSLDNVGEFWLKRSSTNEETINIWFDNQISTISTVNWTTIEDSCRSCNSWWDSTREPVSDLSVGVLSLLGSGDFSGTDCPDWLVSNDYFAPLRFGNFINNSLKLSGIDICSRAIFSFFKLLTNANHNIHAVI